MVAFAVGPGATETWACSVTYVPTMVAAARIHANGLANQRVLDCPLCGLGVLGVVCLCFFGPRGVPALPLDRLMRFAPFAHRALAPHQRLPGKAFTIGTLEGSRETRAVFAFALVKAKNLLVKDRRQDASGAGRCTFRQWCASARPRNFQCCSCGLYHRRISRRD